MNIPHDRFTARFNDPMTLTGIFLEVGAEPPGNIVARGRGNELVLPPCQDEAWTAYPPWLDIDMRLKKLLDEVVTFRDDFAGNFCLKGFGSASGPAI